MQLQTSRQGCRGARPTTEAEISVPVRHGQGTDSMRFLEMTGVGGSVTVTDTCLTPCYRRLVLENCSEMEGRAESVDQGGILGSLLWKD